MNSKTYTRTQKRKKRTIFRRNWQDKKKEKENKASFSFVLKERATKMTKLLLFCLPIACLVGGQKSQSPGILWFLFFYF